MALSANQIKARRMLTNHRVSSKHQFETPSQFAMREPILFGDYRNTLIANEPRLYEDIQDFDASKGPGFKA